jgi:toxin ParE1/3/4
VTYALSREAEEDIIRIYLNSIQEFGLSAADRYHRRLHETFEALSQFPYMARRRDETATRPVSIRSSHT